MTMSVAEVVADVAQALLAYCSPGTADAILAEKLEGKEFAGTISTV